MKTIRNIFALLILFTASNSCMDEYTEVFTANSPVYMSYEDLRDAVKMTAARDLVNPGKIYFKDGYIFINEELKGIHIIDNRNPQNPQNIGFVEIPGNVDIAVKENILYADSYVDLVAIDISNVNNPEEVHRVEDIFPYTTPPYDENYRVAKVDEEKGVVIDWEIKKVRQEMEYYYYPIYYFAKAEYAMDNASGGVAAPSGSTFGVGGSMARFGLYNDYLYAVDRSTLYLFDVKIRKVPAILANRMWAGMWKPCLFMMGTCFSGRSRGCVFSVSKLPPFLHMSVSSGMSQVAILWWFPTVMPTSPCVVVTPAGVR